MTMRHLMAVCLLVGVAACGGADDERRDAATGDSAPGPCGMLTPAQVVAVLPGADGGFATARGRELVPGVRQYQCTYSDPDANLFIAAWDVAATDEQFASIRPGESSRYVRELGAVMVTVGDGGYWVQRSPDAPLELKATIGRTVISLEAHVPNEPARVDALVAAATALAGRLR